MRLPGFGIGAGLLVAGLLLPACSLIAQVRVFHEPPSRSFVAQTDSSLPWQSAGDKDAPAVRYEYPEKVSVVAGRPAVVEMHFRIREGLHINSHAPLEKSFIRTELIVVEPAGIKVTAVDFPPGSDYFLKAFPKQKMSVYTGEVVLRAHLSSQPGEHLIQAALRYQACDTNACYPPKKTPVAIDVVAR